MKKINNKKGFTLIEVLLYTAIFAIVAGLTTGILLTVTQVQQRESASAEVTGQLNFVMQRLRQIVSESSNIEIEAGITTSTLKLRMKDTAKDPTCLSLVSGVIKLAEGPGTNPNECTTTTSDLTSNRVIVDTLNFKKFTQYPGHDTLSLDIQMTYNSQNPKSRVQRTLSSAIARVSAATFDSSLLPGATSYTVGQAGSAWQNVFVGDGSISSPSYSFGADTNTGIFRPGADILGFTTNSTERMRIDASGNVGIGTTGPAEKLHITGSTGVENKHFSNYLTAVIEEDNNGLQLIGNDGSTGMTHIIMSGAPATGDNKHWIISHLGPVANNLFSIGYKTSPASGFNSWDAPRYFNIDTTGNVGIGTTEPAGKLHVAGIGTQDAKIFLTSPAIDSWPEIVFQNDAYTWRMFAPDGSQGDIFAIGSPQTSWGDFVIQPNTGNVGIGTTSPAGKLDVNGTIYQRGSLLHADYVFEPGYEL